MATIGRRTIRRFIVEERGHFFSSMRYARAVSQNDTLLPNERKSERKNGRARALFSRFMKSGGGIQFGGEFALGGPALA